MNSGENIVYVYKGANGGCKWVNSVPTSGVNIVGDPCTSGDTASQKLGTPLIRRQVDLALLVGLELLRRFRSRGGIVVLSVAER
ncbi:hypothetical protein BDB13_0507 [Rhodococcus sp. OK302]|nr:hypothetical protein BDB13_0507 [Rhodococcus sp. OK302]